MLIVNEKSLIISRKISFLWLIILKRHVLWRETKIHCAVMKIWWLNSQMKTYCDRFGQNNAKKRSKVYLSQTKFTCQFEQKLLYLKGAIKIQHLFVLSKLKLTSFEELENLIPSHTAGSGVSENSVRVSLWVLVVVQTESRHGGTSESCWCKSGLRLFVDGSHLLETI